ncbi:hypothetical protein PESP_a0697 [Pseudoalteromonas espejiana DSM 9414]|nr:LysR substrate-binding domain-containing protein [Pseudoalteromonas espejiana]ASM48917.1 hypothetical protein PESP_a0697 [Pseudoalteromonas espejiana DSM 9414]
MIKSAPLKSLYTFIAVAETGSMVLAAEQLSISHSAVSQSIKALESQLNTALFNRIGRRVELNPVGERYYKRIAPAMAEILTASQEASNASNEHTHLTLNMVNSLALHWWIPRVADFQLMAPNSDIRISNLVGEFDLEREGIDAAIIHGQPDKWQKYHCEKLADDQLILVCNPQLLAGLNEDELTPQSLLERFKAIYVTNPRRQNDWQTWCEANNLVQPKQHNNLTFNISVQATQAAMRQLGILVTHKQFVRDDIKHGMLTQIGKSIVNPHQQFYFATSHAMLNHPQVSALREWLKREFLKTASE